MNTDLMFSSKKSDIGTPKPLFNFIHKEFNFDLDVCANTTNAKLPLFISEKEDAFQISWKAKAGKINPVCWMNPPYGKVLKSWMELAHFESLHGCTVVCLVPARTDTVWWWNVCLYAAEIRFLKGRIKFEGEKSSAPFPSTIIIFKKHDYGVGNTYPKIVWWDVRKELRDAQTNTP